MRLAAIARTLGKPASHPSLLIKILQKFADGRRKNRNNRIIHVYQSSPADCGAACLTMIAVSYGIELTLSDAIKLLGGTSSGTSLSQFVRAADHIGMTARPVRLGLNRLADLRLPAMLHWDMNHFVVMTKMKPGSICIADPAYGNLEVTMQDVDEKFTGVAVEFSLQPSAPHYFFKAKNTPPSLIIFDRSMVRGCIVAGVLFLVFQASALGQPFILQKVAERFSSGAMSDALILCGGLATLVTIQFFTNLLRTHALDSLGRQVSEKFSMRVMGMILSLPSEFVRQRAESAVTMQIQSLETIRRNIVEDFTPGVVDALILTAALICLMLFNFMAGAIVFAAVLIDVVIRAIGVRSEAHAAAQMLNAQAAEATYLYDAVRGFQTIKLWNGESLRFSQWKSRLIELADIQTALSKGRALRTALSGVLLPLEFIALIIASPAGSHGTGAMASLFGIFAFRSVIREKTASIINLAPSYLSFKEKINRIDYLRYAPPERTHQHKIVHAGLEAIELKEVSFRHEGSAKPILIRASLRIEPGEFIVITGKSGCGKSTLAKLLLGILNVDSGKIFYGSSEMSESDLSSWRANFSALLQEDILFSGSISENIALFEPLINMEAVRSAAITAEIDEDISSMPMGYSTPIAEGGCLLSAGQRQRVLIARAVYRRSPVMILDEGTAHVDSECERRIAEALCAVKATRIVIAHRSALTEFADRAYELDNGELKEIHARTAVKPWNS
ncbi:peptidase domain-containing ABC transporter [Xanthomonas bonasiae]|uniref:peptidase domain-containing ABC transporter n=1 Tax=Xanthomonas bonasiae TaxID=2810351 RepID=UPI00177D04AD|nr:peptidase domain-containing ABC transporter [Xanthomonas surreyensis]MBD7922485.1 peptidase domain-containing ABC transporter [Xanthomonas surreyensis]